MIALFAEAQVGRTTDHNLPNQLLDGRLDAHASKHGGEGRDQTKRKVIQKIKTILPPSPSSSTPPPRAVAQIR